MLGVELLIGFVILYSRLDAEEATLVAIDRLGFSVRARTDVE